MGLNSGLRGGKPVSSSLKNHSISLERVKKYMNGNTKEERENR
jgi:hypothetical protein